MFKKLFAIVTVLAIAASAHASDSKSLPKSEKHTFTKYVLFAACNSLFFKAAIPAGLAIGSIFPYVPVAFLSAYSFYDFYKVKQKYNFSLSSLNPLSYWPGKSK